MAAYHNDEEDFLDEDKIEELFDEDNLYDIADEVESDSDDDDDKNIQIMRAQPSLN